VLDNDSYTGASEGDAWVSTTATSATPEHAVSSHALEAESLFSAELSKTALLTSVEEEALTRQIVRARKLVLAILRGARRLSRAALARRGRGVVSPDLDFREREAVAILRYARSASRRPSELRESGMDRRRLRTFIGELSQALHDYRDLRDQMVRANVRLVNVLARRYRHPTLSFLDLFQEGTMGLFRAVEKYDPARNIKFSTYATWWIWQQLGRAGDTQGALIRTPVHWNQLRRRLSRDAMETGGQSAESRAAVAQDEGIDLERLETMGQTFRYVSTDTPIGDDDDRLLDLPGDADDEPEERTMQRSLRTHLERALEKIPERERIILRQRFGFEDDDSQTLDEIGTRMGVSRERIRQLENRALKQLRAVCAEEGLQDYLH